MRRGLFRSILAVFVIAVDKLVAVQAVTGKNHHHSEIRHQQKDVEGIPAIEVLESMVGVMCLEVVREAIARSKEAEDGFPRLGG